MAIFRILALFMRYAKLKLPEIFAQGRRDPRNIGKVAAVLFALVPDFIMSLNLRGEMVPARKVSSRRCYKCAFYKERLRIDGFILISGFGLMLRINSRILLSFEKCLKLNS